LGFYSAPRLQLPTASQSAPLGVSDLGQAAIGRSDLRVSPLQMALAAAGLSNGGLRPAARVAISVHTPDQGWVILPNQGEAIQVYPDPFQPSFLESLAAPGEPYWQAVGSAPEDSDGQVTWFIGGTLPEWQGTPYALALVVEADDVDLARQIATDVLDAAIQLRSSP